MLDPLGVTTSVTTFASTTLADAVAADNPELAFQLRNLGDGSAQFAFLCGVYNGLIETVAAVSDLGKLTSGALSTNGLTDLNQTMGNLQEFKKIDENNNVVCSGAWCALRMGLADNFSDRCKIAEFGGEIAFVIILATIDPAALEGVIGGTAAKIVRVLQYLDNFPGKVTGLDYVVHFTSNGVGKILNSAKRAFGSIVDEKIVAKAINEAGEIIDLPNAHINDIIWEKGADEKLIAKIENKSYQLLDQSLATRYLELTQNLRDFIDIFGVGNVKLANNGQDILLLTHNGDEFAKLADGKVVLTKADGVWPDPTDYLSASYIANHLAKFDEGVSCLKLQSTIDEWPNIGAPDGLFVLPKIEMDALLAKTGGDIDLIQIELGIPDNIWKNAINDPGKPTKLVRIDIHDPIGLRMALGKESTANKLWIPGGKTPEGWNEAVVNPFPKTDKFRYIINDL